MPRKNHVGSRKYVAAGSLLLLLLVAACGGGGADAATGSGGEDAQGIEYYASYAGADREQVLTDCAAGESGSLQWYTSSIEEAGARPLAEAFMAKYPTIQVDLFREDGEAVAQRVAEEYAAGRYTVDVVETTVEPLLTLKDGGVLVPFTFPDAGVYLDGAVDPEGYYATSRESYVGFGYNTNLVDPADLPTTSQDLLDPRWAGMLAIPGSNTARRWLGGLRLSQGPEFVAQMLQQDLQVFDVSGRALADLVISGEVVASPTIFDSHVFDSKQDGAPIEWIPLEPLVVNNGAWALPNESGDPCSALLFIDFALTKAGQEIYMGAGYGSAREDLQDPNSADLEKVYLSTAVDDYEEAYQVWNDDFQQAQQQN